MMKPVLENIAIAHRANDADALDRAIKAAIVAGSTGTEIRAALRAGGRIFYS